MPWHGSGCECLHFRIWVGTADNKRGIHRWSMQLSVNGSECHCTFKKKTLKVIDGDRDIEKSKSQKKASMC